MNFNSLKVRIFLSYLVFILIIIGIILYSFVSFRQYNQLKKFQNNIYTVLNAQLTLYKIEKDFYSDEILDAEFYKTGKSKSLEKFSIKHKNFENYIFQLKKSDYNSVFGISTILLELEQNSKDYKNSFFQIVDLYKIRGFKDYGVEGNLRKAIHKIEYDYPEFDKISLLSLRRIEKDYIIRKDIEYVKKMNEFKAEVLSKKYYPPKQQNELDSLFKIYFSSFEMLTFYDNKIGLFANKGEKNKLKAKFESITSNLTNIEAKVGTKITKEFEHIEYKYLTVLCISILFAFIFAIYISDGIAIPVKELENIMQKSRESKFVDPCVFQNNTSIDEIVNIQNEFLNMSNSISKYVAEIKLRNEDLKNKNLLINEKNTQLNLKEQELTKSNKLKETFISIISHDIRSPLNTLKGFLNIIIDHPEYISDEERKENFLKVRKSTELQLNLLNNLLNWSRAQSIDFNFEPQKLKIDDLSNDCIRLLDIQAKEKSITIQNHIQSCFVLADKNMFELVFRNIVSNSIKFTNQNGKIVITSNIEGDFVIITVADNGIGIDKESLEKLNLGENQFSTEGTFKEKGTGFGLIFCRTFAQKMGGTMVIESELGQGTTIKFSLLLYNDSKNTILI